MEFIISIAGKNILIDSVYNSIYNVCKDYLVKGNEKPDFEIHTDTNALQAEVERSAKYDGSASSLGAAERFLVQRRIAESLIDSNAFLMHGAVIAIDNTSYMFTGRSGVGKTTHIKKWIENVNNSYVVNGDKPMILISNKKALACGTPWCGKENFGRNVIVPLHSIVFMERSVDNYIERVPLKSIFPALLEQIYQPKDTEKMKKTLELVLKLQNYVAFYKYSFNNFKDDAFRVSFESITKDASCRITP